MPTKHTTTTPHIPTLKQLDAQFKRLQKQRKALKAKFQADLDARFEKYRADVKALRAKKDELWEAIKIARKAKKTTVKVVEPEVDEIADENVDAEVA